MSNHPLDQLHSKVLETKILAEYARAIGLTVKQDEEEPSIWEVFMESGKCLGAYWADGDNVTELGS